MTSLKARLAALGAFVLALATFGASQRRKGRKAAQEAHQEADQEQAAEVRRRAEAVKEKHHETSDLADDALNERLRQSGGLRD